jgi:hypothetical protein
LKRSLGQLTLGGGSMNDPGFKFKYIELLLQTAEGRIKTSDSLQEIVNTEFESTLRYMNEFSEINKGVVIPVFDNELYKKHHNRYLGEKEYNLHFQDSANFLRLLALDILFHGLYLTQVSFEKNNIPNAVASHKFFKAFQKLDDKFKNTIEDHVKKNWGPGTIGLNVESLLNQFQKNFTQFRYPHQHVEWVEGGYSSQKILYEPDLFWLVNFLIEEIKNWGQTELDDFRRKDRLGNLKK